MKHRLLLAGSLLCLSSCAQETRFEVGGSEFCVPNRVVLDAPTWLPAETPDTPGFAFDGCSEVSDQYRAECGGRRWLIAGTVAENGSYPSWKWEDGAKGAYYWNAINEHGATVDVTESGSRIVVKTPGEMATYLVWSKAVPLGSGEKPFLTRGDELMAVCSRFGVSTPKVHLSCTRFMKTRDFAISYSFTEDDPAGASFTDRDLEVERVVDKWRCEGAPE